MQSNNNDNVTPATVVDVGSVLVSPNFASTFVTPNEPYHFDTCDEINDPLYNHDDVVAVAVTSSKKKEAPPVVLPDRLSNITEDDLDHVITELSLDIHNQETETARSLHGYSLMSLSTYQLRKVCSLLGVGGYKSQSKVKCCLLIAQEKNNGAIRH